MRLRRFGFIGGSLFLLVCVCVCVRLFGGLGVGGFMGLYPHTTPFRMHLSFKSVNVILGEKSFIF